MREGHGWMGEWAEGKPEVVHNVLARDVRLVYMGGEKCCTNGINRHECGDYGGALAVAAFSVRGTGRGYRNVWPCILRWYLEVDEVAGLVIGVTISKGS